MDKRKLREIYRDIKKEVKSLYPGDSVDFGGGSYQDAGKIVTVTRMRHDKKKDNPLYLVDGYPSRSIPRIVAMVYRAIIDDVTEYGFNPKFF